MSQILKIVFLGTPYFAVASLNAIYRSKHQVVGVITMPDKRMGRKRELKGSAVKEFAIENGLMCLQPTNLKDSEFVNELQALQADIFVVVAFRMLPEIVWNMPPLGTVNVHASLLPQYRGAAPINWAIINGEEETGVTVFKLKHEIDTGDILLRKSVAVTLTDNAETLHDKLMVVGASALIESVDIIASGNPKYLPQLTSQSLKPAPKIFKETCHINWNQSVEIIFNFIRGLSPYPTSWTEIISIDKTLAIKIFKASIELNSNIKPFLIDTDNKTYLKISGKNGWIHIHEIQLSGKKKMNITDLLRGFSFQGFSIPH